MDKRENNHRAYKSMFFRDSKCKSTFISADGNAPFL